MRIEFKKVFSLIALQNSLPVKMVGLGASFMRCLVTKNATSGRLRIMVLVLLSFIIWSIAAKIYPANQTFTLSLDDGLTAAGCYRILQSNSIENSTQVCQPSTATVAIISKSGSQTHPLPAVKVITSSFSSFTQPLLATLTVISGSLSMNSADKETESESESPQPGLSLMFQSDVADGECKPCLFTTH